MENANVYACCLESTSNKDLLRREDHPYDDLFVKKQNLVSYNWEHML